MLEKISNNYHLNEFIYEFDNGMVMHSEIFDAFKKYSDAVELKNILPEKTYAGVSAKNLTKKLLMNALIFKLLGDCMNGRRETDQRVKGVLNTINKYKPWSNFVFKIKEKAHIPKPVYEEFMKFYNAENE